MKQAVHDIEKIKSSLNINAYEAKVWLALLSRGIASASELADISKVPRSRCYDVLETLEKKGFVFQKIGKPVKFMAVQPDVVVETLKKEERKEQNRLMALYEELEGTKVFEELKSLYSNGVNFFDNDDIVGSVAGKQNVNVLIKNMLSRATKEISIHTDKENVKRKLKLASRAKIPISISADEKSTHKGTKVEQKNIPIRFIHMDDNEILFFTSPRGIDDELETAVYVKSNFFTNTLKSFLN